MHIQLMMPFQITPRPMTLTFLLEIAFSDFVAWPKGLYKVFHKNIVIYN